MDKSIIKKISISLNVFLALATIIMAILHIYVMKGHLFHYMASYTTCLLAILNFGLTFKFLNKKERLFSGLIAAGVLFATLGDSFINKSIILGGSLFATGHVLYIASFCMLHFSIKKIWQDLICVAVSFGICMLIVFVPAVSYDSLLPLVIAYGFILSSMLGKSLSNAIFSKENRVFNIIIFIGALLFFASDMFLFIYWFKNPNIIFDILCFDIYMLAQTVLASTAMFLFVLKKNKQNTPQE